jgi:hypothetical protein
MRSSFGNCQHGRDHDERVDVDQKLLPEVPVKRPTRFQLVVNLKTAKALGITMPTSLLLLARRGDRIIAVHAPCCRCSGLEVCRFLGRRDVVLSTRAAGRRRRSAKARSRGRWSTSDAAGSMGIVSRAASLGGWIGQARLGGTCSGLHALELHDFGAAAHKAR